MPRYPVGDFPWGQVASLLDAGKAFQARRILISHHRPDDPGFEPAGAALSKLWGLDYLVQLALIDKLKEATDPNDLNPLGLGALRWILGRRREDLRFYLKPGVLVAGTSHETTSEPIAQEQELKKALDLYQGGDTHEAQARILNVVNLTSEEIRRLDSLAHYKEPLGSGTLESYVHVARPEDLMRYWTGLRCSYLDEPPEGPTLGRSLTTLSARLEKEGLGALVELPDKPRSSVGRAGPIFLSMFEGHIAQPDKDTTRGQKEDKAPTTTSQMVRRIPHLEPLPEPPFKPGQLFDVQVYANTEAARPEEKVNAIELDFPPGIQRIDLTVHLLVSGHFKIIGTESLPLSLDANQDSTVKMTFHLRVRSKTELKRRFVKSAELKLGNIAATFSHNGRPAGSVSRDIPVDLDGVPPVPPHDKGEPPGTIELDPLATSADLVVEVKTKPSMNQMDFSYKLSTSCLKKSKLVGKWFDWKLPEVTRTLVKSYMKGFTKRELTPQARLAKLRGAGKELFDVAPKNFRKLFWQLVDSNHLPHTIAIVSEEAFIPWELMIPNRLKANGPESRDPLGVEFTVGRWVPRNNTSAAQRFALAESIVVAPRYEDDRRLEHADEEAEFVRACIPGLRIDPARLKNITYALEQGKPDLIHFVGHGSDDADGIQTFDLEGQEQLDHVLLRGLTEFETALRRSPTLVLLNACEVGRAAPALCGAGGFAQTMIVLGVGGVIAALWSVKDNIAHQIAKHFYSEIKADPSRSFAEILRDIRKRAYSGEAEDTYAAYCFYGDPMARRIRPTDTANP